MERQFFYLRGFQPNGVKKRWFWSVWAFGFLLLCTILILMIVHNYEIREKHYLYISVVFVWLIISPLIKPKAIEIDFQEKMLSVISLLGGFRLSNIRVCDVVSIELIEGSDYKFDMVLVGGRRVSLSIDDRAYFFEQYNKVKNSLDNK